MEFSNTLKELRIKKGLSQSKLAKITGFSQSAIGYWERGEKIPSINAVTKIATALECDISELIDVYAIDSDSADVQKIIMEWKPIFEDLGYRIGQSYYNSDLKVTTLELKKDSVTKTISFPNEKLEEIERKADKRAEDIRRELLESMVSIFLESIDPDKPDAKQ